MDSLLALSRCKTAKTFGDVILMFIIIIVIIIIGAIITTVYYAIPVLLLRGHIY